MPPCIIEIVKSEHENKVDSLSGDADGVSYECSTVGTAAESFPLNDTNAEDISNKENSLPSGGPSQQDRSSGDPFRTQVRGRLETSLPTSAYRASDAGTPVIIFDDFASVREKNDEKASCASGAAGQLIDSGRARIVFDDFPPVSRSHKSLDKEKIQDDKGPEFDQGFTSKPTQLLEESFPSLTKEAVLETLKVTLIEGNKPKKAAKRKSVNLAVSMSRLRECVEALKITNSTPVGGDGELLRFKARISPEENTSAEAELDRQLSKSDFASMAIYGQFNLGFLIVGHRRDLFIVDQHATDEKYNFETLQRTTVIGSQRMVAAQRLELTSVGEAVVMDNLAVFQRNGFQFQAVFGIHMFLDIMDPDPDPLVRGMNPDPDRSIIKQK
jgi:DNA mismatch repair ATPase MutL